MNYKQGSQGPQGVVTGMCAGYLSTNGSARHWFNSNHASL